MTDIIARRAVDLQAGETSAIAFVALPALTEQLLLYVERPTVAQARDFAADCEIRMAILVDADGDVFRCETTALGGLQREDKPRAGRLLDVSQSRLCWLLPCGYFGARCGMMKRLGENRLSYAATFEIECLSGALHSFAGLTGTVKAAPAIDFEQASIR